MQQRYFTWLMITVALVVAAVLVLLPSLGVPLRLGNAEFNRRVRQGLDLQGGLQVLLEADVPEGTTVSDRSMRDAVGIVENRVNALGLTEPLVQRQGSSRIVVELPGITDPQEAVATLRETALLEFVYTGPTAPPDGTTIQTDCVDPSKVDCGTGGVVNPTTSITATATAAGTEAATAAATVSAVPSVEPTAAVTGTATTPVTATETVTATQAVTSTTGATPPAGPAYHTVMTGVGLRDATVAFQTGRWVINFQLTNEGASIFGAFTAAHISEPLAIVLDKQVISAPTIENAIQGSGQISGRFTQESANRLALQLRSGALPVPLKVVTSREVGPTLGQDSVRKSVVAGVIGMLVVGLFMALYYRLPGAIAVTALIIYALLTFALFILIPVTLTLPGIAGFVLSVGVAVDANILIFERMKEELRAGRTLRLAVDQGFARAWPSIRDSNISTLITCLILFWFGSTFGASIVKGFALTLALGVGVSLFTAILVTRTILHLVLDRIDLSGRQAWFGI
jgi:preprotein translocase subunit SecD